MIAPLQWSSGRSAKDTRPQPHEAPSFAEMVDALESMPRSSSKAKSSIFYGPMASSRSKDSALACRWLAVDADGVAPHVLHRWRDFWEQFRCARWSTHSSQPEVPRERVVVELEDLADRPTRIATGADLGRVIAAEFGRDVRLDPSVYRPEQPIYLPPPDALVCRHEGKPAPLARSVSEESVFSSFGSFCTPSEPSVPSGPFCKHVAELFADGWPPDCIPPEPGHRHRCLFALARRVKGVRPAAAPAELAELHARWYADHHQVVRTGIEESLLDFVESFDSINFPHGQVMARIIEFADALPVPRWVPPHYGPNAQKVAKLAAALAAHWAPEPFYVSCRQVAAVLGVSHVDAARHLRQQVRDGLLEVVHKGVGGNRATRYRLRGVA